MHFSHEMVQPTHLVDECLMDGMWLALEQRISMQPRIPVTKSLLSFRNCVRNGICVDVSRDRRPHWSGKVHIWLHQFNQIRHTWTKVNPEVYFSDNWQLMPTEIWILFSFQQSQKSTKRKRTIGMQKEHSQVKYEFVQCWPSKCLSIFIWANSSPGYLTVSMVWDGHYEALPMTTFW